MTVDIEDFEFAIAERFRHALASPPTRSASTPRELATALTRGGPGMESSVSVTARAFFRIRRYFADVLDVDAQSIGPSTRCRDLLADHATRRIVWTHFREFLHLREAPRLYRPRRVEWPIAILTGTAGLTAMLGVAALSVIPALFFLAGALAAGGVIWALLRLTRPWAYEFVPAELTLGALAHYAVAYGSPILADLAQPANRGQTLEVIQSLARLEIGAPRVHPDATWEQLVRLAHAS
jgi:hypothetical protein